MKKRERGGSAIAKLTYLFKRVEKKYFIDKRQYDSLISIIGQMLNSDEFGKSTVSNIYLDTPAFLLIRNSIDAKKYKEKLRVRGYGEITPESRVFLELKKKYNGIVYKRRIAMSYGEVCEYIYKGIKPCDSQIMREIDWCMNLYGRPAPAVVLSYEREACFLKEDKNIRLTFDRNVRYRTDRLSLTEGDGGKTIIPPDRVLLEIKTPGAMPLWLSDALTECKIYPSSFSKYGKAYADLVTNLKKTQNNSEGSIEYV